MKLESLPLRYQMQIAKKLMGERAKSGQAKGLPSRKVAVKTGMTDVSCNKAEGKPRKEHRLPVGEDKPKMKDFDVKLNDVKGKPSIKWMKFMVSVNPSVIPTAQQKGIDARGDRVRVYTKQHIRQWKKAFECLWKESCHKLKNKGRFGCTDKGVMMSIEFRFPYPDSTPMKKRCENAAMVKRPDCDNLAKMLVDTFSASGVLPDDNCISRLVVDKAYTLNEPYILFTLAHDYTKNQVEDDE